MIWLTQQTLDRLNAELEDARGPKRAEIVARISAARDEGDRKENGAYQRAKDEQGTNEARIRQLEEMLADVSVEPAMDDGKVSPGKVVTYKFDGEPEEKFLLAARDVGDDEGIAVDVSSPESP